MLAVRRRRRRSSLCLLSTGSPFGHHPRLSMVRLRRRREWICAVAQRLQCDAARGGVLSVLFSTGSPFGHHPRLSMVRLRQRREWICAVAQRLQCDAAGVGVLSVLFSTGSPFGHHPRLSMVRLRRRREFLCVDAAEEERWYEHLQTYAICKGGGRRNASTCSPTVPRGDTLCVTAGDAQRANPWKVDKTILRHWRCRTAATPAHLSFSLHACSATQPETRMELYSCYSSSKKILFPYT